MMEYEDAEERREALARLIGVEKAVWVQVEAFDKVRPIANEDLDRETEDKTSAVHFMRFELNQEMIDALRGGAALSMGIDHPAYTHTLTGMAGAVRESLLQDLQ